MRRGCGACGACGAGGCTGQGGGAAMAQRLGEPDVQAWPNPALLPSLEPNAQL